jgi:hypothetical protein
MALEVAGGIPHAAVPPVRAIRRHWATTSGPA